MTSSPSSVDEEIEWEIVTRYRYSRFDFVLNHILVFLAVACSAFPAFAHIFGDSDSETVAVVAAIPALVLLLQKTFKWEQRAEWHWRYRQRIIAIKRELRDQGLTRMALT